MSPRALSTALPILFSVLAVGCASGPRRDTHELLDGVLWVQTAAEYEMSCEQAYALATLQLDRALADRTGSAELTQGAEAAGLPPAVILDVDETVLDNSPFEGRLIEDRGSFTSELWNEWAEKGVAAPVPGAVEFTRRAAARGVAVFYVTNRDQSVEEATRRNLADLGFPLRDDMDCILTRKEREEWGSDKASRRAVIAEGHRIVMLVGDDANDFFSIGKLAPADRKKALAQHRERWGVNWILLPNPLYGGWEKTLYDHDYGLCDEEKLRLKLGAVRSFE